MEDNEKEQIWKKILTFIDQQNDIDRYPAPERIAHMCNIPLDDVQMHLTDMAQAGLVEA